MKTDKEFNNILDECLERLLVKGETIEQCLSSYPEYAAELEPLLHTAMTTKKVLAIQPSPEFKARARYQLGLALQEAKPKRRLAFLTRHPRWATAIASFLALLLAGGGTVVAAGNSMPGDFLYPVKLATEQVQLTLTTSDIGKAELYAKLADKRVAEIVYIVDEGKPEQVELTAERLNNYLVSIASLSSAETGDRLPLLAPAAEEYSKDGLAQTNERTRLRVTLESYAVNHPAALRAVLETAPESVKPALRRAITISVDGYAKALEALD
jgi:hypothetical protein